MRQYVEKMIREKEDLEGKINRARKAIADKPYGMDKHQTLLLAEQVKAMEVYFAVLKERIEYERKKEFEV